MVGMRMWRRRGTGWLAGLLVLLWIGTACTRQTPPTAPAQAPTAVATPLPPVGGSASGTATASGKVVPAREADLSLAVTGWVQTVHVAVGDAVGAGEILLVLDSAAQTAEVAQARAAVQRTQANLTELQAGPRPQEIAAAQARLAGAQAHLAQVTEETRAEEIAAARADLAAAQAQSDALYAASDAVIVAAATAKVQQAQAALERLLHPATASQIAEAEAQVQSAAAELDMILAGTRTESVAAATAAVAEAEAALQRAEAALAGLSLRAPFTGTVAALTISPGEMVQSGQIVLTVADLSRMQVETTDLSERDVTRVGVGQPAVVFVKALNTDLLGHVARVAPQATIIGGDVVYTVLIDLDQHPPNLRWGMSVDVEIEAPLND